MSSIAISSILVVLSIVAIIYLTAKVKFNVFGALFAVTMALAVFGTGLPFGKVIDAMKTGFGNTLGGISFIIFDIEVVFLYPWAVDFTVLATFGLVAMLSFLALITVPFVYEWRRGGFEWD